MYVKCKKKEKRYPFHIPTLGSLVLVFDAVLINELLQP